MKRKNAGRGKSKSHPRYSPVPLPAPSEKDPSLRLAVLDALLQQLPVGVVIANGKGRIVLIYENEIAQRIRTSDPQQIEWPVARALLLGEVIRDEEIEITMSDGTRRWLSVSGTPIRSTAGKVDGAVVTFADVTAVREAGAWRPVIESLQRL
jgi:PAS domain-containing protein